MGNVDSQLSGNYPLGLYHGFEQLKYSALMQDRPKISGENVYSRNIYPAYLNIANSYAFLGNTEKANEYINKIPQDIYIPEKFGIRIEDMVLVTKKDCEILSDDIH